jgi:hypothetical protein
MQKTAGTTLRDRLRNTYTEDQIYPNGSDGPDGRISVISLSHLQACWKARGQGIRLLTGHFPIRTPEVLEPPAPFVTMTVLRDPVERILSFLRHQAERRQRGADPDTPLWEIYTDPVRFDMLIHNHMTRMLSMTPDEFVPADGVLGTVPYDAARLEMAKEGLAGLPLFGLQDRLEEFCGELASRYGLDVGDPLRSNTTERDDVPEGLVERIVEDNALDIELYAWARKLYDERHPGAQGAPA